MGTCHWDKTGGALPPPPGLLSHGTTCMKVSPPTRAGGTKAGFIVRIPDSPVEQNRVFCGCHPRRPHLSSPGQGPHV